MEMGEIQEKYDLCEPAARPHRLDVGRQWVCYPRDGLHSSDSGYSEHTVLIKLTLFMRTAPYVYFLSLFLKVRSAETGSPRSDRRHIMRPTEALALRDSFDVIPIHLSSYFITLLSHTIPV